jgi:hypothetical protein
MRRQLPSLLALAVLGAATLGYAETCDAGHGCKITCKDGCSAIYNEDNGRCSKACGAKARTLAKNAPKKDSVSVSIKGLQDDTSKDKEKDKPKPKQ